MEELRARLDAAVALLVDAGARFDEGAAAVDDDGVCELVAVIEAAGRAVDALRVRAAGELDARLRADPGDRGLARRHGVRSAGALLERGARVSASEAGRRVRLGAALRPRVALTGEALPSAYPVVAAALAAGDLGADAAHLITRALGDAARTASVTELAQAERALVESAEHLPPDLVGVQARAWRDALDPDGAEPRDERRHAARWFRFGREVDGMTPFSGLADPVNAALLRTAIGAAADPRRPRFIDSEGESGRASGAGDPEPSAGGTDDPAADRDPRTPDQRRLDALIGLVTAGSRAPAAGHGDLPASATVVATVTLADLIDGVGTGHLDDVVEPVPVRRLDELVCLGGFRRILTDLRGRPLVEGRRERLFTRAQRRALAARDRGCVWPGCGAPPSWCHAHHVVAWQDGGRTDVDNGVLLCAFHHHLLHRGEYRLRMIDRLPHLLSPRWIDPRQRWRPVGKAPPRIRAA